MSEYQGDFFGGGPTDREKVIRELRNECQAKREDPLIVYYCPICDRRCKRYKRNLYSSPIRALLGLYHCTNEGVKMTSKGWLDIRDIYRRGGLGPGCSALQMLGYYDLARCVEEGFWVLTDLGRRFVERQLRVPKYVLLYNDEVIGFDDTTTVDVVEALGTKFNYWELMSR